MEIEIHEDAISFCFFLLCFLYHNKEINGNPNLKIKKNVCPSPSGFSRFEIVVAI